MRQVVLDTETTGLEPEQGHRIIEIGAVEVVNRRLTGRHYHQYLNPERGIDAGAMAVHGITDEFVADKPLFAQVAGAFLDFVRGAELIIHNAPFDLGFLNHELRLLDADHPPVESLCTVFDTLQFARERHPGQRNSLDALCLRYEVDNSQRELHGALLDAEILADVYLTMTGGQTSLALAEEDSDRQQGRRSTGRIRRLAADRPPLRVVRATAEELAAHEQRLAAIDRASRGATLWRAMAESESEGAP